MAIRRYSSLSLILFWVLMVPANGWAQGKCGYLDEGGAGVWVSADFGAGISVPIPTSYNMGVEQPAAGFGGGVKLHLPHRLSVGVGVYYRHYQSADSVYRWGTHLDILGRGSVAVIMNRHFQWDFSLLAGMSRIVIRFLEVDPDKPVKFVNGVAVPNGLEKKADISALSAGGSSRVSFFPMDALGLYFEAMVLFSYQQDLLIEWGPLSFSAMGGLEFHL